MNPVLPCPWVYTFYEGSCSHPEEWNSHGERSVLTGEKLMGDVRGWGITTGCGGEGRMQKAFLPVTPVLPRGKLVLCMLPLFAGLIFKKTSTWIQHVFRKMLFLLRGRPVLVPSIEPIWVTTHRQSHPRSAPPRLRWPYGRVLEAWAWIRCFGQHPECPSVNDHRKETANFLLFRFFLIFLWRKINNYQDPNSASY